MGLASEDSAEAAPSPSATADMADLLLTGVNTSPLEDLITRPLESLGVPSFFFSPRTAQYVILKLLLSSIAAKEVPDMIRLVNEAF